MSERAGNLGPKQPETASAAGAGRRARTRLALELVALRGKDVIGVRHLRDGGSAWVGNVGDALARIPTRDLGGHPFLVGEVRGGAYVLHLPLRARARLHGTDGIPRLMTGPHRIELHDGDRAVLVLGGVQIRAQLVPLEAGPRALETGMTVGVWAAAIGLVYAALLLVSTTLSQPSPPRLSPVMARIHQRFLPHAAPAHP
jgi:hypothetical protein